MDDRSLTPDEYLEVALRIAYTGLPLNDEVIRADAARLSAKMKQTAGAEKADRVKVVIGKTMTAMQESGVRGLAALQALAIIIASTAGVDAQTPPPKE